MTVIKLETLINAPIEICFDCARDIDAHKLSTAHTKEIAIAGRTAGLCEEGDTITWQAKHLGIKQNLTVKITKMQQPVFFEDIMLKGAFKLMKHKHFFEKSGNVTLMKDKFVYEVPFGIIGKIFDALYLRKYMTSFLVKRNEFLKNLAESKEFIKI